MNLPAGVEFTDHGNGEYSIRAKGTCSNCKGTGLYVGMAEKDGAAVVCHTCKGSGCASYGIRWRAFNGRQRRDGIKQVVEANPGIVIGADIPIGGMSYQDWLNGRPFEQGMEMRQYVCPGWWYQSVDYDKKPKWSECGVGGTFSGCKHFDNKAQCWARFDRENQR